MGRFDRPHEPDQPPEEPDEPEEPKRWHGPDQPPERDQSDQQGQHDRPDEAEQRDGRGDAPRREAATWQTFELPDDDIDAQIEADQQAAFEAEMAAQYAELSEEDRARALETLDAMESPPGRCRCRTTRYPTTSGSLPRRRRRPWSCPRRAPRRTRATTPRTARAAVTRGTTPRRRTSRQSSPP